MGGLCPLWVGTCFGRRSRTPRLVREQRWQGLPSHPQKGNEQLEGAPGPRAAELLLWSSASWPLPGHVPGEQPCRSFLVSPRAWMLAAEGQGSRRKSQGLPGQTRVAPGQLGQDSSKTSCVSCVAAARGLLGWAGRRSRRGPPLPRQEWPGVERTPRLREDWGGGLRPISSSLRSPHLPRQIKPKCPTHSKTMMDHSRPVMCSHKRSF